MGLLFIKPFVEQVVVYYHTLAARWQYNAAVPLSARLTT